jgi:hypothetical protein
MTAKEIQEMPETKIRTIQQKVGQFGALMMFKVMKENDRIIIVTRDGLLKYMGNAQQAYGWGKKGKDYKEFKTATAASKFINGK